jgi:proliferating cell nuclear antigen
MFSAKMNDSKVLKGMIDAVSAIIDETYFVADQNGLNLSAMDESHICLMGMNLPKELFAGGYECVESVKMGINLEDMSKVMKRASGSDAIEFKHAKDGEKFQVQMKGRGTRTFSIRLIDIDEEKTPPSAELDVQFDAKVTLDVDIIEEAVKDAEIYQDTLEFQIDKEGLKMSAAGEVGAYPGSFRFRQYSKRWAWCILDFVFEKHSQDFCHCAQSYVKYRRKCSSKI